VKCLREGHILLLITLLLLLWIRPCRLFSLKKMWKCESVGQLLGLSRRGIGSLPTPTYTQTQSQLYYDRRSAGQSVLEQSTHLGHTTRSLLLSDSCGLLVWGALSDASACLRPLGYRDRHILIDRRRHSSILDV
jgi:hypothetical protein